MFLIILKIFILTFISQALTEKNEKSTYSHEYANIIKYKSSVNLVENKRYSRSVFHVKQNPNERYLIEGKEKPAVNKTRLSPRPSFALSQNIPLLLDPKVYRCIQPNLLSCQNKTQIYRKLISSQLKKTLNSRVNETNYYNVAFKFRKFDFDLRYLPSTCLVMRAGVKVLKRKDQPFNRIDIGKYFPKKKLFRHIRDIKSCAIVSSAGSMTDAKLGKFIDSHDIVMRFNNAPVRGYEGDVGSKTTIRVVNSQVVTKSQFNFTESILFHNITIAAWDPGKYNDSLEDWIKNVDFDLFTNYEKFRKKYSKSSAYLINPQSIWKLWQSLQIFSVGKSLRKNPPSSGFIGLALLLPHCQFVDFIEYIPSTRLNGRCHYYNKEMNAACTFGVWHPLAAEKLMTLDMNVADDFTVFQEGILRIRRPDPLLCNSITTLLRF